MRFKRIILNGVEVSTKEGMLIVGGSPLSQVGAPDSSPVDMSGFATIEDVQRAISQAVETLSGKNFVTKAEFESYVKKSDLEDLKKEIRDSIYSEVSKKLERLELLMKQVTDELKKPEIQNKISSEFPIYYQLEAIVEAFCGKPKKIERIKERIHASN